MRPVGPRLPKVMRSRHRWTLGVGKLLLVGGMFAATNAQEGGCTPRRSVPSEGYVEPVAETPSAVIREREATEATALGPSETRSACEAACEDVFMPEATGFAPVRRPSRGSLLPLAGARGWWLDAVPGREHSALLCVDNEPPELECPWVLPLEATVAWDTGEEPVRASLSAAEGLLEITLHRAGTAETCSCLPFDLRAQAP